MSSDDQLDHSGIWPAAPYTGPERRRFARATEPRWLLIFLRRLWSLIAYSDTTPTRFLLMSVAAVMAIGLVAPGDSLSRPAYSYLAEVAGSNADLKWSAVWAAFCLLTVWRIFSARPRPKLAFCVNLFGAMLFSSLPVAIYLQRPTPFPIGIVPYAGLALAAAWVAVRTNINSGRGWRAD